MEMMAAIEGLQALSRPCTVAVYTDSEYLRTGYQRMVAEVEGVWLAHGCAQTGEERGPLAPAGGSGRPSPDQWHWVKGHAGHPENERADALANRGLDERPAPDRAAGLRAGRK